MFNIGMLLNKWVIGAVVISAALAYHYWTVTSLERDLAVSQKNTANVLSANDINISTINSLKKDLAQSKSDKETVSKSYILEISKLKAIIFELNKPVVYKETIKIKNNEIKVKKLEETDNENSIIRIISTIGK